MVGGLKSKFGRFGILVGLAVLSVLFFGCGAYFNTFYNAKKYFKEAERKRLQQEKGIRSLSSQPGKMENPGGLRSRGRTSNRSAEAAYRKAIEKGSKVLELYPNSRYVDDAIMIIGQSLYHTRDYLKARRKFEELLTYFPESEYVPQARLWLGKTLIQLNDYGSALSVLTDLIENARDRGVVSEARFLRGELYFTKEDFRAAVAEFESVLQHAGKKSEEIRALVRIGECYLKLKQYEQAAAAFKEALDREPPIEMRYDVEMRYAKTLRKLGKYEVALQIFERMTRQALTKDEMASVKLEIQKTLIQMGEFEQAEIVCEDIGHDYAKTEHAARAYFELGKMYALKLGDFRKAKKQFEQAQTQARIISFRDTLQTWLRNLEQWDRAYFEWRVLDQAWTHMDTTSGDTVGEYIVEEPENPDEAFSIPPFWAQDTTRTDSLKKFASDSTRADSLAARKKRDLAALSRQLLDEEERGDTGLRDPRSRNFRRSGDLQPATGRKRAVKKKRKKVIVPKNPKLLKERVREKAATLAQLYLFQFENADSALKIYDYLLQNFSGDLADPQWFFACAYLYEKKGQKEKADSLYHELLVRYPKTEYARYASRRINAGDEDAPVDSAALLFSRAETYAFDKNQIDSALFYYTKVAEQFPESPYAPKALYAKAWLFEWMISKNDSARKVYEKLRDRYPATEYGRKAKQKLAAMERALSLLNKQQGSASGKKSAPDSSGKSAGNSRKGKLPAGFVEDPRQKRLGGAQKKRVEPDANEGAPIIRRRKAKPVKPDSTRKRTGNRQEKFR